MEHLNPRAAASINWETCWRGPSALRCRARDARFELTANNGGWIDHYKEHPEQLQHDKKYFETWNSAVLIASTAQKDKRRLDWNSSVGLSWILPAQKTDAWGHAFCIHSDQEQIAIVSPGPRAFASLDCSALRFSNENLAELPSGRLVSGPSGVLILHINNK